MRFALVGLLACVLISPLAARGGREMVHPDFDLPRRSMEKLLENTPAEAAERILSAPTLFLDLMKEALDQPEFALRLVDKTHALPKDFAPPDLVPLSRYRLTTNKAGLSVSQWIVPDLLAMAESAAADGVMLVVSSTYRSFNQQQALFEAGLRTMPREELEKELAVPGHSQHQLGTTIDFGSIDLDFAKTPAGVWLQDNASKFGFTLSYPEGYESITGYTYEPWHYRYISRSAARIVREYFGGLQQRFLEFYASEGQQLKALRRK